MTEQDKPFVCYKSGWSISIKPRNAAGWRYFAAWMSVFALLTGGLVWLDPESQAPNRSAAIMVGYVLVTIAWALAMTLWMKARSEVIDLDGPGQSGHSAARGRRGRSR